MPRPYGVRGRNRHRRLVLQVLGTSPSRTAYRAACVRSVTPSLPSTLLTCVLTVFSETPRLLRDHLVRLPARDQRQYLALARSQQRRAARPAGFHQLGQHARRDLRMEEGLAGMHGPDRADELPRLDVLEQVAGRSRAHGGQQLVVVEEGRQHDHARAWIPLPEAVERGDPVDPRHDEVEQDHVGVEPLRLAQRLLAVFRLADDLDLVLELEERAQSRRTTAWSSTMRTRITAPPRGGRLSRGRAQTRSSASHQEPERAPPSRSARACASGRRERWDRSRRRRRSRSARPCRP